MKSTIRLRLFLYLRLYKKPFMTKLFVPICAIAMLTFGSFSAQAQGKPAPAVKKETAPVNKKPVPVARPVVPVVAKPAAPTVVKPAAPVSAPAPVAKPAAPAVAKPAAPAVAKPAAPAPAPAPVMSKTVTTVTKKTVTMEPCPPVKTAKAKAPAKPAIAKSPKKAVHHKAKNVPSVTPATAQPMPQFTPRPSEAAAPAPAPAPRVTMEDNDGDDKMEPKSACCKKKASCGGEWKSINGCSCYSHAKGCYHNWKCADCDASCRYIRANYKQHCHHHHYRHAHCCK